MKRIIYFIVALITVSTIKAANPDWGKTGHRTIGEVASSYLKKSVKHKIENY